jgi:hypothetical protein
VAVKVAGGEGCLFDPDCLLEIQKITWFGGHVNCNEKAVNSRIPLFPVRETGDIHFGRVKNSRQPL